MPRIHIRCNVITDPEMAGRRKLHISDLQGYLPCFYNVPVKTVYEVLGLSHHTLAPLRRQWNLKRWPFADICRGAFMLGGRSVLWDDIEDLRKKMMEGADDRIAKILEVMGERALKYKGRVNVEVARRRREERDADPLGAPLGCLQILPPQETKPVEAEKPAEGVDGLSAALQDDGKWLEDFSRDLQGWFDFGEQESS